MRWCNIVRRIVYWFFASLLRFSISLRVTVANSLSQQSHHRETRNHHSLITLLLLLSRYSVAADVLSVAEWPVNEFTPESKYYAHACEFAMRNFTEKFNFLIRFDRTINFQFRMLLRFRKNGNSYQSNELQSVVCGTVLTNYGHMAWRWMRRERQREKGTEIKNEKNVKWNSRFHSTVTPLRRHDRESFVALPPQKIKIKWCDERRHRLVHPIRTLDTSEISYDVDVNDVSILFYFFYYFVLCSLKINS